MKRKSAFLVAGTVVALLICGIVFLLARQQIFEARLAKALRSEEHPGPSNVLKAISPYDKPRVVLEGMWTFMHDLSRQQGHRDAVGAAFMLMADKSMSPALDLGVSEDVWEDQFDLFLEKKIHQHKNEKPEKFWAGLLMIMRHRESKRIQQLVVGESAEDNGSKTSGKAGGE